MKGKVSYCWRNSQLCRLFWHLVLMLPGVSSHVNTRMERIHVQNMLYVKAYSDYFLYIQFIGHFFVFALQLGTKISQLCCQGRSLCFIY